LPRSARASNPWIAGLGLLCLVLALPILAVLWMATAESTGAWSHLLDTVLVGYFRNTILLMGGVAVGTVLLGVPAAWLVTNCRFPGVRVVEWALLLPFAMPAYILAFLYTDLLEFAGPVQGALRDVFGWQSPRDYWFPQIRSLPGAVIVLSLALYPYVYLLARASLIAQSVCVLEASRTLGCGVWGSVFQVALPLLRPAVAVGVALALMETAADFGTVSFFSVNVFTTGIYKAWLIMYDAPAAARLACMLLVFVLGLILLERWSRRRLGYQHTTGRYRSMATLPLRGGAAGAALAWCALPIVLGFLLPAMVLLVNAVGVIDSDLLVGFWGDAATSLGLGAGAAALVVAVGVILAYGVRLDGSAPVRAMARFASLGYALPGSVIAIGVLIPFGALDNFVDGVARETFGFGTGLVLSGTVAAMLFAYLVRFVAVGHGAVEAGLGRIPTSIDGAARLLGERPVSMLRHIHAPIVSGSILTAGLLVFVEVLKELPASIILRPFGVNTLAIRAYEYAIDEQYEEASVWALLIVATVILPVIGLSLAIRRTRPGAAAGIEDRGTIRI
ncbi:MAG: iron ABC transporter permease, partial [Rhodospirillaceae bacterium]|nr:iron ABC transporter permease [Rhodospirillaceae bacterium]